MGRVESLGKITKKWIGQGKDIFFVAKTLSPTPLFKDVTPEKCAKEYLRYINRNQHSKTSESLTNLITKKQKIHLYGEVGVGKSFTVKNIAEKLKLKLIVSYARSEDDLLKDFGDYPFGKEGELLFVLEGEGFYWRKYGLVKTYIEKSNFPIVIITNNKDKPTKSITKLLKQVKAFTPTRADVLSLVALVTPDLIDELQSIYSKDWRKVWRNILYKREHKEVEIEKKETIDARNLSYLITKGTAKLEDFDRCIHPISFVLNWLGYNATNFWEGKTLKHNLEIISWCDANKYNKKSVYVKSALVNDIIISNKKGYFKFPPFQKNKAEEKVEDNKFQVDHIKKKKSKKKKKPKKKKTKPTKIVGDVVKLVKELIEEDDDMGDF